MEYHEEKVGHLEYKLKIKSTSIFKKKGVIFENKVVLFQLIKSYNFCLGLLQLYQNITTFVFKKNIYILRLFSQNIIFLLKYDFFSQNIAHFHLHIKFFSPQNMTFLEIYKILTFSQNITPFFSKYNDFW